MYTPGVYLHRGVYCAYERGLRWYLKKHGDKRRVMCTNIQIRMTFEPRYEISNNVVCATSKGSDQCRFAPGCIFIKHRLHDQNTPQVQMYTPGVYLHRGVYCAYERGLRWYLKKYGDKRRVMCTNIQIRMTFEPRYEISNNVVCATSKGSDQSAYMRSLIRAFASHFNIVWLLSNWPNHSEFLSLKGGCTGSSESILVKMTHCWKSYVAAHF